MPTGSGCLPTAIGFVTMADIEDLDVSGVNSQPRIPKALVFPKRATKTTEEVATGDSFIPGAVSQDSLLVGIVIIANQAPRRSTFALGAARTTIQMVIAPLLTLACR